MPTIGHTGGPVAPGYEALLATWTGLAETDDGAPVTVLPRLSVSVQVTGAFGGATVVVEGSNEEFPTTWATLNQPGLGPLSFTAAGLGMVLEPVRWIRPRVVGGSGTSVTVSLVAQ